MIVGYQGEMGCYSYNSIKKYLKYVPKAFKTFEEVFIALNNGVYDDSEEFTDKLTEYKITSPTQDDYKESRFLIFKFHPGNPGYIKNDETSWENKPAWNFPLK